MAPSTPSPVEGAKEIFEHTSSPLAKVIVGTGDAQETHYIHSSLLCAKSEYFRACLKSGFSESAAMEVDLQGEDPKAFRYFVKWIYTGDLAPFPVTKHMDVADTMIDVYVLADRILCNELQNRAMDMFQAACSYKHITVKVATKAIRSKACMSMLKDYTLKQLSRDMFRSAVGYEGYMAEEKWHDLIAADPEATSILMRELLEWKAVDSTDSSGTDDPAEEEGCRWHVHEEAKKTQQCERWEPRDLGVGDLGA